MKQILIILGLLASVSTFAQSPRIKLNQITKDSLTGSVLISSPSDSGMVYSRDFYIAYGADTVLILYGDTLAATSGIISSVLSDGVTITGDGTSGNELKVDTATVISTIQGLVDTLTNYVTIAGTETITGAKTFTNTFIQSGGDVNFDSNTLYVDESENSVGIGTNSINEKLVINGNGVFARISNASTVIGGIKISYQNSNTHGLHLLYYPADAISYIDNTYPISSGQVFGDIQFRQNVSGSMTQRMVIKAENGNIGIGTISSPAEKLHVVGNIVATGSITPSYSDYNLKTNISDLTDGLNLILDLKPKTFNFISDNNLGLEDDLIVGLIAQDVEQSLSAKPYLNSIIKQIGEYKAIDIHKIIPITVLAIQEQQAIIETQEQKITDLETTIQSLITRIENLENK